MAWQDLLSSKQILLEMPYGQSGKFEGELADRAAEVITCVLLPEQALGIFSRDHPPCYFHPSRAIVPGR